MADLRPFIAKAATGAPLSAAEARDAFDVMMSGGATPSQIGGFLMALRVRGETVDEIVGAVTVMREKMTRVDAPDNAIDIVGTGGDNSGSYNVSTCAAFIAAGAGATIAKHGNRSLSSKSGSAEALSELGLDLEASPKTIERCIREGGLGFMFAPMHHSAMRHVGPSRVELGTRTIFNLLGPLSNPAGVSRQLVGVFALEWVEPVAHVLKEMGSEHVWVVYGDGLDEITTAGETQVAELKDGSISTFTIKPEDHGIARVGMEALKGGDPKYNAAALRQVLKGARNAYRDIACLNAAAGLVVAGMAATVDDGLEMAFRSIDEGHAEAVAENVARLSQEGVE